MPITFGELIPKDKRYKNDSENISVLQNDVCSTSRYVNFTIRLYIQINVIPEKLPQISGPQWLDRFSTSCKAEVKVILLELNVTAHKIALFCVTSQKSNYNVRFD